MLRSTSTSTGYRNAQNKRNFDNIRTVLTAVILHLEATVQAVLRQIFAQVGHRYSRTSHNSLHNVMKSLFSTQLSAQCYEILALLLDTQFFNVF